jgi:hypothetical protein
MVSEFFNQWIKKSLKNIRGFPCRLEQKSRNICQSRDKKLEQMTVTLTASYVCEIWGSGNVDYEDYFLLDCDVMESDELKYGSNAFIHNVGNDAADCTESRPTIIIIYLFSSYEYILYCSEISSCFMVIS